MSRRVPCQVHAWPALLLAGLLPPALADTPAAAGAAQAPATAQHLAQDTAASASSQPDARPAGGEGLRQLPRPVIEPPPKVERPLWEFGLGAGVLRMPHYRGADQSHTWWLPVPYFIYRGEILKADRGGARAQIFDTRAVEFDLSVAAGAPTRSDDNEARRGMRDLAPTVEVGPKLGWTLYQRGPWKFQAQVPVRAAFTLERSPRSVGWLSTPHLNLDYRLRAGWNLGLRGGLIFGDRRYHGYYYEVRPEDALPDRPVYRPGAGYGGQQYYVALSRRFPRHWVGFFASHDTVRGAKFESSPLVRSRSTYAVGIAFSWVFATSSQQVLVED